MDAPLYNALCALRGQKGLRMHMPGHKGKSPAAEFSAAAALDYTEIGPTGNLYTGEGPIAAAEALAARDWGAAQAFFLAGGSTQGVLAGLSLCAEPGSTVLLDRNAHRAFYSAMALLDLTPVYLDKPTAEQVSAALSEHESVRTVCITSPTYYGVIADVEKIAAACRAHGARFLVDEAHGAHFRYDAMFPVSALDLGADVVIQSVHKTLPSLTQTALLHIKCNRPDGGCYADRERIDRYIHMVQSSSPSYVLMASIENSIYQMEQTDTAPYGKQLHRLRRRLGQMRHLRLADTGLIGQAGIRDLDISKIVVSTRGTCLYPAVDGLTGFTGAHLDDILRREYHLEMEMCGADYVTAITTVMDSGEGLERLGDALTRIDTQLTDAGYKPDGRSGNQKSVYSMRCDTAMSMGEAMEEKMASVGLEDSAGCISGEFVYIYPPGIPIVAPGEWISGPTLEVILEYRDKGLPVQGPADKSLRTIRIVQKD